LVKAADKKAAENLIFLQYGPLISRVFEYTIREHHFNILHIVALFCMVCFTSETGMDPLWVSDRQVRLSIRGVGGSIPALVDVSLSKTLNPELLPVAVSTAYERNMIVSRFG